MVITQFPRPTETSRAYTRPNDIQTRTHPPIFCDRQRFYMIGGEITKSLSKCVKIKREKPINGGTSQTAALVKLLPLTPSRRRRKRVPPGNHA